MLPFAVPTIARVLSTLAPGTVMNENDRTANVVLSNGNLTAACTSNPPTGFVRATTGRSAGKYAFDVTRDVQSTTALVGVSIPNASNTAGVVYYSPRDGSVSANNNTGGFYASRSFAATQVGATHTLAFDLINRLLWIGSNGAWLFGDPETGTDGFDFAAVTGIVHPSCSFSKDGQFTFNFGQTPLSMLPAKFQPWTV